MCFTVCAGARRVHHSQQKEDTINSSSKRCYIYSVFMRFNHANKHKSANRHRIYRTCHGDMSVEGAIGTVHKKKKDLKKGASFDARRVNRVDVYSFSMN